jgi:hypothetical protein
MLRTDHHSEACDSKSRVDCLSDATQEQNGCAFWIMSEWQGIPCWSRYVASSLSLCADTDTCKVYLQA